MIIPVVSKNAQVLESLNRLLSRFTSIDGFVQVQKDNYVQLVGAHGLVVLDTCTISHETCLALLKSYHIDDWSVHRVVVLITDAKNRAFAQELSTQFSSIIAVLPSKDMAEHLCGVLYLFELNRNILIKIKLQAMHANEIYLRLVLHNNPYAIPTFARAMARLLRYYGFVHVNEIRNVQLVVSELCVNAIEHGNCMISYQEKKKWLETHADSVELINEKNKAPEVAKRYATCLLCINGSSMRFEIIDQGGGFNWRKFLNDNTAANQNFESHGYGINLALAHAKHLHYNSKGNAVSFSLTTTDTPKIANHSALFSGRSHITYKTGEKIVDYTPLLKGADAHIDAFQHKKNKLFLLVDGMATVTIGKKTFHQDSNDIFCGVIPLMLHQALRKTLKMKAATAVRLVALPHSEVREVLSDYEVVKSLNQSLIRIVAGR